MTVTGISAYSPADASANASEAWRSLATADLRSCSAWDAYKALHASKVDPALVAEFLLLAPDFPRSVRFCAETLDQALRAISGSARGRISRWQRSVRHWERGWLWLRLRLVEHVEGVDAQHSDGRTVSR